MNNDAIRQTLQNAKTLLFQWRLPAGHWEGELSSSALSTATAVVALWSLTRKPFLLDESAASVKDLKELIERGIQWLAENQNPDGGWGDTILSESNISTTVLVWAAFQCENNASDIYPLVLQKAEIWIQKRARGVDAESIANVILKRYGKDRTFSVPILTMCALTGRLGPHESAWDCVMQLPFELAACPHQWFTWLRLPVVSYALPALIAIGQARHQHRPTRNPIARLLRDRTSAYTLNKLREIQPSSGGYLEATPLTSFVTMSLASFLDQPHPVVTEALRFLTESAKPDGSWAIDTNLSTWVTTLAINALAKNPDFTEDFAENDRQALSDWILYQQYRTEHPYTHAAPGGWAWTPLPGGVPDADDTSGALLALKNLGIRNERTNQAVQDGIIWLIHLQNRDGGVPTFCRGWTNLPFDRSCADITAHALRAMVAWYEQVDEKTQGLIRRFREKALGYLGDTQQGDGAWAPLWFGNEQEREHINWTYGTAQVTTALVALHAQDDSIRTMIEKGVSWLIRSQAEDGGWGGTGGLSTSIEETSLAVEALTSYALQCNNAVSEKAGEAAILGAKWLMRHTEFGSSFEAAPIGFYFAELWYFESLYPIIFSVGALEAVMNLIGIRNEKSIPHWHIFPESFSPDPIQR